MDDPDLIEEYERFRRLALHPDMIDGPVGITVHFDNGDVEPVVEVVYAGPDERGIHVWRAGVVPNGRKVVSMTVARMPAGTGVRLVAVNGEGLV